MAKDHKKQRSVLSEVITREYTIHMHRRVFGTTFKKRAPKSIKVVQDFARKEMGTKDVRIDPALNKHLWSLGIRSVPHRVRVRLARKRDEDEEGGSRLYTYVTYVPVASFKGLNTETVDED
ncbi:60S ribosomal protein L31B [Tieghemiomyces parasiticus]|uniref:60S ribosomal protein L31B n=1 Tax=Tieghemiomyces parasiticus TaxID=78921 RepID=A0A9W7ZP60_9FUNG|nr:60S ribosomal protein L31B [Tieghemiomyces parasiticus]KAJ1923732.1 60S ribosomal protein L31B [Tieghemiomyces parasiticus]